MPYWVASLLFAVLVVTIPFSMILRILQQLPRPDALSHRRWSQALNIAVIGAITIYVTIFIRSTYYVKGARPAAVLMQFLIAGLAYAFGLVLILRQFAGVYPDFIVTTGRSGLALRKIAYRRITRIDQVSSSNGEIRLRVHTVAGTQVPLTLPSHAVPVLYERVRAAQAP
jgi:hypothetical protein